MKADNPTAPSAEERAERVVAEWLVAPPVSVGERERMVTNWIAAAIHAAEEAARTEGYQEGYTKGLDDGREEMAEFRSAMWTWSQDRARRALGDTDDDPR